MNKSYNIRTGLVFSVTMGFIADILPRLLRMDAGQPRTVLVNFVHIFIAVLFYWWLHHFILIRVTSGFLSHPFIKPVLSILLSVIIIACITWAFHITSFIPVNSGGKMLARTRSQFVSIRVFRAGIISALTYFVVFYYRMQLVLRQSKQENEYLKQENLQAQLSSLKQHISPHFLFNALNTLSSLSHEAAVKEYILKLSDVYRYVLRYQEKKEVKVEDELFFIQSYMYIIKTRFEEGINIKIAINPGNLHEVILPFSLQLLVENAIKHNSVSYRNPLSIDIYDQPGMLVVENDLRPRHTMETASGTGLQNLSKRYRLAGGRDISITRTVSAFKVEIPFLS